MARAERAEAGRKSAERGRRENRSEMLFRLQGYRLTTAEILYHMPDHPGILQTFIWQELDLAPRFPALQRFLDFWNREIEGKLHSVRVGSSSLIGPQEWRNAELLGVIH